MNMPSLSLLIGQLGWTLLHFLWQGTLIAAVTGLGLRALRHGRPQARYALACLGLFACLAWPTAELLTRLAGSAAVQAGAGAFAGSAVMPAQASPGLLGWLQGQLTVIVFGWAACACALSLRMLLGLWWIDAAARRYADDAHWQAHLDRLAHRMGIGRAVRLRVVGSLASPLTAGWWRPIVLLPASLLTGMPPDLVEALLAHELAHVQRCDYLVNLAQNLVETVLFYHPAVWWISSRIRTEREHIADDLAAHCLGEPRRLALALSELEKRQFSHNHLALAANQGDLMSRIKRLLRPAAPVSAWKDALPVLGLSAALFAAAINLPAAAKAEPVRTKALADFSSCAKPLWPAQSLKAENQGTVTLKFLISKDGKVMDSKIAQSSGFAPLDEAARTGISKCAFKPAREDGVPVQGWSEMRYVWTLK